MKGKSEKKIEYQSLINWSCKYTQWLNKIN